MKLAFTTLGCPEWELQRIIEMAVEYGFDGVDFRGLQGEMNIYHLPEFSTRVKETLQRFREAGLEVPCFSSSIRLFTKDRAEQDQYVEELKQYLELCSLFEAPYIRVFGGKIGDVERQQAIETAVENAQELSRISKDYPVQILLETHDDWTKYTDVLSIIKNVEKDALGVLWDVHHPYRTEGEAIEDTWQALGERVQYTHWKDSYPKKEEAGHQLCLMGEGDIPLPEIYQLLRKNQYDGYLTLEWEKKWHPEIEEPEVAFPQFIQYMRKIMNDSK